MSKRTEQILLIDQGNTRLKWAWAHDGVIDEESGGHGDLFVLGETIRSMSEFRPARIIVSSVAGDDKERLLADFSRQHWRITAEFLESRAEQGGVRCAYADPSKLGVDRWLAIVGAVDCYGKPVVIWDLGTATTVDAVDATGQHLGGFIFPGPATMLRSLQRDTRLKVPADPLESARGATDSETPGVAPGTYTDACISRGVLAAQLGALNQFMRNTASNDDEPAKLIATGGAAGQILPLLDIDHIHDPWLVFRGMLVN